MTPAARVQTAIEILERIETSERPADQVVAANLRGRRYIGSKDRRAITGLVYDVIRRQARLDWWLGRVGAPEVMAPAERPRLRVIAQLALDEGGTTIESLFDGSQYGPPTLSEEEASVASALGGQSLDHAEQPDAVRAEMPAWLLAQFEASLGDQAWRELDALRGEAPLDLRVNSLKADRDGASAALEAEGIAANPTLLSPLGLRLSGRHNLPATPCYREGLVEVQDEASQLAALLVEARPGMAVADFCAGAGGKTLALAATMANEGRLLALDRDGERLGRARPRLSRAGAACVESHALTGPDDPLLAREAASFDRVLVDAPCTGSGAWRRNPDARWRLTEASFESLQALQAEILQAAAGLVRPGGRLIYATCSLFQAENAAPVEAFLEARSDFVLLPYGAVWESVMGGPPPDDEATLTLTPAGRGTDGFYVAILECRS